MNRLLIKDGYILTMDDTLGELPGGSVLVEGERIVAVAPTIEAADAQIIDAQGNDLRITYTGKIVGDELKLTRQVGDFGKSEATAKRQGTNASAQPAAGTAGYRRNAETHGLPAFSRACKKSSSPRRSPSAAAPQRGPVHAPKTCATRLLPEPAITRPPSPRATRPLAARPSRYSAAACGSE